MKKLIIMTLLSSISLTASAEGFYGRFWRGERKTSYPELKAYCDDSKTDCFKELINRWLIPATPSYAAEKALTAYAPVLLPKKLQNKYQDEVALILYDSEKKYRELRGDKTNFEGSTYGPIHGDIFEMGVRGTKESSRSLVPQEYKGKIELTGDLKEVSYDIMNTRTDLPGMNGCFKLVERGNLSKESFLIKTTKYLDNIKGSYTQAAYALVTEDYLMIYIFNNNQKKDFETFGLEITWTAPLTELRRTKKKPLRYDTLDYGQAGNLFFKVGTKPGMVDHYRLHL